MHSTNFDDRNIAGRLNSERSHAFLFSCGILSGIIHAAVFHPWDRALYLSVTNKRSFLNTLNFRNPLSGILQTISQRGISAGLYFPLEESFTTFFRREFGHHKSLRPWITFLSGILAGALHGIAMNPFASVKVSI